MFKVGIIGAGYVADLYMRSFEVYDEVDIVCVYDRNDQRLKEFCSFWNTKSTNDVSVILNDSSIDLVLNLTNPSSHYEISLAALSAGKNVYSEKPLATKMEDAEHLFSVAKSNNLHLGSAPCSFLSETAQTVWYGLRKGLIGKPLLVYAELDDDFIPQSPHTKWFSESGAKWPYEDEMVVGCTLEHAGYYLTWLMMMFGSVIKLTAMSENIIPDKLPNDQLTAPDFSTVMLSFDSGVVARLTCSIIAPHDHRLRIHGDEGVMEVDECWNNSAAVKVKKRRVIRRRLVTGPFSKKVKLRSKTHRKLKRRGAAAMNFALGPLEMLRAIRDNTHSRVSAEFALHLNEVTLAIQNAGWENGAVNIKSRMTEIAPMSWASLPQMKSGKIS